ncbi:MAG: hypothetical protein D5R97_02715 [Candidatus Syntrophonatronum acetioxidans]|uniref:Uncharacterized protein n=1 Tax=Candidatus Syntrophonatronum acetioxidans TaxID=1795816 RepID=A0A424YGU4_9FIRM|nr:MAG: hypothetical protein D5R97_02715 [Candidatus Syntrophonatronum acetioxidans]
MLNNNNYQKRGNSFAVTPRIKPLRINGEDKEIKGMFFYWGFMGLSTGPVANDISPSIGDANTTIPEYKSFL